MLGKILRNMHAITAVGAVVVSFMSMRSLNKRFLPAIFAVFGLAVVAFIQPANALVITPAPDPIGSFDWTATAVFSQSIYSDESNEDVGNQNPANVGNVLASSAWFDQPVFFVGGGACDTTGISCDENANNFGSSTFEAVLFGIHFDNKFLALLYPSAISNFSISGLPNGVSNIYAYSLNPVPLPAAGILFGSALVGISLISRRRRKRSG